MRISGTEPSSVTLSQTKKIKKRLICYAPKYPNLATCALGENYLFLYIKMWEHTPRETKTKLASCNIQSIFLEMRP